MLGLQMLSKLSQQLMMKTIWWSGKLSFISIKQDYHSCFDKDFYVSKRKLWPWLSNCILTQTLWSCDWCKSFFDLNMAEINPSQYVPWHFCFGRVKQIHLNDIISIYGGWSVHFSSTYSWSLYSWSFVVSGRREVL